MPRRSHILLILLLGTALRFHGIDHQSLWYDEGNSARMTERSTSQIVAAAAADIHPPGYYLALASWRALVGQSEFALRGLSAMAGIILIALVYRLGRDYLAAPAALLASLLTAIHPALIYYSQEARMYMLAATLGAALFLCMHHVSRFTFQTSSVKRQTSNVGYVLTATAGLYTHYSFPFVLIAANLAALWQFLSPQPVPPALAPLWGQVRAKAPSETRACKRRGIWRRRLRAETQENSAFRELIPWAALQLATLLLFLPWLPTAIHHVTTWPATREYLPWHQTLPELWRWLTLGPTIQTATVIPGLLALSFLALLGLRNGEIMPPLIWLLVPTGLTIALGVFTTSFAKFLLLAVPALALLVGNGIAAALGGHKVHPYALLHSHTHPRLRLITAALVTTATMAALWAMARSLVNLYNNPEYFRDDYRTVAADLTAALRDGDAILLNAPNQWEVFTYYYSDTSQVIPIAHTRPLDVPAQIDELEAIAANYARLFVLYWGESQSDPDRVIEHWLNQNTFKTADRWYGKVRLATYAVPIRATGMETKMYALLGDSIVLEGYTLNSPSFAAGDILQLTLFWHSNSPSHSRHKTFVHVYGDTAAPPVAQHDSEPVGSLRPTTTWTPGETVADNHGVLLPADLPAGAYQLTVGMYSVETGARSLIEVDGQPVGDYLILGTITVNVDSQ